MTRPARARVGSCDGAPRTALASAELGSALTFTVPIAALPPGLVVVQQPRAPWLWTDSDPATIAAATGMPRPSFLDAFRVAERDPEAGRGVVYISRKRRGIETDAFLAFLAKRYSATARRAAEVAPAALSEEEATAAEQARFEAELGIVDAPAPASAKRARSRKGGARHG